MEKHYDITLKNGDVLCDHSTVIYEIFDYVSFRCEKLIDVLFIKCVFRCCSFKDCDFNHSQFENCVFESCDFIDSCFSNTEFNESYIDRCSFRSVFDNRSRFIGNTVSSSYFKDSESFGNCDIHGSHFNKCRFHKDFDMRRFGEILEEDLIGWKKCTKGGRSCIVKLLIPKGAIVFSINGKKCRTNKCKVLDIFDCKDLSEQTHFDRASSKFHEHKITYYPDDEINIKNFDMDYAKECATGVHFFKEKTPAWNYGAY